MTRFLRSESEDNEDNQEEEEEEGLYCGNSIKSTPLSSPGSCGGGGSPEGAEGNQQQYPILAILVAALRKSLVTCSVEKGDDDDDSMDIGRPTHVRHLSHVTFDRFSGFLGLPTEFQPQLPPRVPSASASVFGVSAESMQCSYDQRGNSVPTILLMMQKQLYSAGGLQAEGIFRITGENSQEEYVRSQLNRGIMPCGIDVHCLAGLIKAWLRELPTGVLDSLTAEQVMHCNTENDCVQLAKLLPPTEAALLNWAINLMADVVQHEHHNKMNARNIAMVFAPNMTQMADPLTALIHAVQVMNFLKTLILKTLREREELATEARLISSCVDSPTYSSDCHPPDRKETSLCNLNTSAASDRLQFDCEEEACVSPKKRDLDEGFKSHTKDSTTPVVCKRESLESDCREGYDEGGEVEGTFYWPSLRKGVRKLCRNAVPQTSKPEKKSTRGLENVNTRGGDGEAWV